MSFKWPHYSQHKCFINCYTKGEQFNCKTFTRKMCPIKNQKYDYFIYDYIDQRVIPDNYTIRASTSKKINGYYTKSCLIEGSNDNETWETIDEVKSSNILIEKGSTYTIPIYKSNNHKYRYIRLSASKVYDPNNCYLSIDSLDLLISI